ncbi:MAG: hypothetical protein M5U09_23150 [Gammaproteobacteria bacterium]|nr:hypothetical protein [Gammaproteobacteria bacterium]
MSGLALALVLGSAVIHASWNLLAKLRAAGASQGVGGAAVFTWLFATLTVLAYAPVVAAFVFWTRPTFTTSHAFCWRSARACCTWVTSSRCSAATGSATCRWCTRWRAAAAPRWPRSGRRVPG